MESYHEEKIQDGWILYYSEEGYPYYYKESTEESEWAPLDSNFYDYNPHETITKGDKINGETSDSGESETEDYSEEDNNNEDDSNSDPEPSTITEKIMIDKVLEAKFLDYLKTPEGIAAAEAELERVGRKLDKRNAKRTTEAEINYVRGLASKKKDEDGKTNNFVTSLADITTKVLESTNAWMFPPHIKKKKKNERSSSDSGNANLRKDSEQSSKYDDYNRETKQRYRVVTGDRTDDTSILESGGRRQGRSVSPNSSRSSSVSSDTASFSSDDSDVAEIDAPLFSDLPAWLDVRTLSSQLFGTPTVVSANLEDNTGDTTSTSTAVIPYVPANLLNLAFIQSSTTSFAQQGFQYIGGAFVQGFGMLFERLNPLLEDFVSGVIDTQLSPAGGGNRAGISDIEPIRTDVEKQSRYKDQAPSGEQLYRSHSSAKKHLPTRISRSANSTPRMTDQFSPRSPPPSLPSAVLRSLPVPKASTTLHSTSLNTPVKDLYEQIRKDESTVIGSFREEGDRSTFNSPPAASGFKISEKELPMSPSWAEVVAGSVEDGIIEDVDITESVSNNLSLLERSDQQQQLEERVNGDTEDENTTETKNETLESTVETKIVDLAGKAESCMSGSH